MALLRLFEGHVPDCETHSWVVALAASPSKWPDAHRVFDRVRNLYNETPAQDPFDSDSPHWIIKCAIGLARRVGVPVREVIAVVVPEA